VPALVQALGDRSATVRREAAFALGLMGDTTTVGAIALRWEREPIPAPRETMVTAIGYLGAQAGAPAIARALEASGESERWRRRSRPRDPLPLAGLALTALADDVRSEMRWRVAYALGRVGDRVGATALRNLARDKVELVRSRRGAWDREVGDSASAPLLATMLRDAAWRVR